MSLQEIIGLPAFSDLSALFIFLGIFGIFLLIIFLIWLDGLLRGGRGNNDLSNRGVIKRPPDDSKPGRKNPHGTKRPGGGTRVGKFNADGSLRKNEENSTIRDSDQFTK